MTHPGAHAEEGWQVLIRLLCGTDDMGLKTSVSWFQFHALLVRQPTPPPILSCWYPPNFTIHMGPHIRRGSVMTGISQWFPAPVVTCNWIKPIMVVSFALPAVSFRTAMRLKCGQSEQGKGLLGTSCEEALSSLLVYHSWCHQWLQASTDHEGRCHRYACHG